ncbi:apelin receptor B-like [Vombatus ursinus]|uniref:apelin receptor B-like n=1 Tax=Vombatus ursinus TaxID=29139 RepID=UPI000FFCFC4B|nr:apelin receptor B-like [Vombatus ursinus]
MQPWTAEPRGPAPDDDYYYYYYDYYNGSGGSTCGGEGDEAEDWQLSYSLLPLLYALVFVLGLSGNGAVIVTLWRAPGAGRRPSDAYLGHLAAADLAFVVTLPLWAAYTALRFHWPFGAALCKLSSYLVLLTMFAGAFCLTGLSFERYRAVGRGPGAVGRGRGRGPGARAALAALWLLSAVLALPALLLRDTRARPPANLTVCDVDFSGVAAAPEHEVYWLGGLSLATTLLGFALPAGLMGAFYCRVGRAVRRPVGAAGRGRRRRLLRLLAALVAVFALCWLPFHALKSLHVLGRLGVLALPCPARALVVRLHPYATCLAYANSCLNPLLYPPHLLPLPDSPAFFLRAGRSSHSNTVVELKTKSDVIESKSPHFTAGGRRHVKRVLACTLKHGHNNRGGEAWCGRGAGLWVRRPGRIYCLRHSLSEQGAVTLGPAR